MPTTGMPQRVGLATVFDGATAYACAMVLWCASATRLSRSIPRSEVVIVSRNQSQDCPHARYVWTAEAKATDAAAAEYLSHTSISGGWAYLKKPALLKVAVLSLVEYDLLLFVDMDADLWPDDNAHRAHYRQFSKDEWVRSVAAFMQSRALFVGSPDHASPLNTGIWLLKPRAWLFQAMLRALLTATWNSASGFNGIGTPHAVANSTNLKLRLMSGYGKGGREQLIRVEAKLKSTEFLKESTWKFVGGNIDQGKCNRERPGTRAWARARARARARAWTRVHAKGRAIHMRICTRMRVASTGRALSTSRI